MQVEIFAVSLLLFSVHRSINFSANKAGDGVNYPQPGNTVTVHYSGFVSACAAYSTDFRLSLIDLLVFGSCPTAKSSTLRATEANRSNSRLGVTRSFEDSMKALPSSASAKGQKLPCHQTWPTESAVSQVSYQKIRFVRSL